MGLPAPAERTAYVDEQGVTSLDREVSRLIWARRLLTLKLPDLGENFSARRVAPQPSGVLRAANSGVTVEPGVYALVREGTP